MQVPARPSKNKPGNRRLVAFFKVLIVAVLIVPWVVAVLVGISFYNSAAGFNQDVDELQERVSSLTGQREDMLIQIEEAEKQIIEITEEKEVLQRTARDTSNDPEYFESGTPTESSGGTQNGGEGGVGTVPDEAQLNELARQVIIGNWGNGLARVLSLNDAGYNSSAIQQRVNEIIWGN
ncbi:MAG: hypothetical protein FWE26_06985 [Coriobacteriia bacterium]|nr:hypothetical protein [Coriobacteriia bacterium]